jgi:parvulin-like peptidyl-prolyl isomerase
MKNKLGILGVFLGITTTWAAPGDIKSNAVDNSVVATVGDSEVKLSELKEAISKLDLRQQATASQDPATLNQVVRLLLVQRLLLNEARDEKWDEKAEVKAQVDRAKDTAIAESYLQNKSQPPAEFPTEAELKQTYETLKPNLGTPEQWRLAQIYIAATENISKEELSTAEAKLDAVKKALADPKADFSKIATEKSSDQGTASRGGEIGWLAEAAIVPEIRTEATLLKENEVSKPIRLKDGWHILKCLGKKEAFTPDFADVKEALKARMRQERAQGNSQAYIAKLLQENPLSINEIAIKDALAQKKSK